MARKRQKNPPDIVAYPDFRSRCPIASALDLVGDRWTLVVLRSMFAGASRFAEFAAADERIASNILADRLEKLEAYGLVGKSAYQDKPVRYRYWLTARGAEMLPVLKAIVQWSTRHIPDRFPAPPWFMEGRPEDFAGPDADPPGRAGNVPGSVLPKPARG